MKTEIKINVTTRFNQLFRGNEGEAKERVTKEIEEKFHEFINSKIHDLIEEDLDELLEDFMEYTDCYFENIDSFADYGKINIRIEEGEKQ